MKSKLTPFFFSSLELFLFLLFAYSGFTKLWSVNLFEDQLVQSPLIPESLISLVATCVPVFEILLAGMLLFPKYRQVNLMISFSLMLFFSLYLSSLYFFFEKPPCACGGILGKVSYPTHIFFNYSVTLTILVALVMTSSTPFSNHLNFKKHVQNQTT